MTPVCGPFVGHANPIRGIPGAGLPWVLAAGTGYLSRDGHLHLQVRGLVLAHLPAVPASLRGTNPFPAFRATVSCQSIVAANTVATDNVSTGDFRTSLAGDLEINARVSLPQPCLAPVIFITGPSGVPGWLAVTGS